MAYRRKQGVSRASTFKDEVAHYPRDHHHNHSLSESSISSFSLAPDPDAAAANTNTTSSSTSSSSSSSSLAAQAIRASSAHRDSSLSSAYRESAFAFRDSSHRQKSSFPAAALRSSTTFHQSHQLPESSRKIENPSLQKRFDALTSSLSNIGGTIGKSFEEGLESLRSADIIQETRKLQIRKKGSNMDTKTQVTDANEPQLVQNPEIQLKASRDVAMAMAAKAKLLLRELKTVKADLAFAKERCNQLEEENRILRESHDKGDQPEDDDLIRLQLETLLDEKARLANENSIYARENRFLREIVEYHQLTMQDVVYLDEGIEEVTEVYPITVSSERGTCPALIGPSVPPVTISSEARTISSSLTSQPLVAAIPEEAKDIYTTFEAPSATTVVPKGSVSSSSSQSSAPHI